MDKEISGPTAGVIVALALVFIALIGYFYVRDPPKIKPEQTRAMMNAAQSRTAVPQQATQPTHTPSKGGSAAAAPEAKK
jgi:hypothetical protein